MSHTNTWLLSKEASVKQMLAMSPNVSTHLCAFDFFDRTCPPESKANQFQARIYSTHGTDSTNVYGRDRQWRSAHSIGLPAASAHHPHRCSRGLNPPRNTSKRKRSKKVRRGWRDGDNGPGKPSIWRSHTNRKLIPTHSNIVTLYGAGKEKKQTCCHKLLLKSLWEDPLQLPGLAKCSCKGFPLNLEGCLRGVPCFQLSASPEWCKRRALYPCRNLQNMSFWRYVKVWKTEKIARVEVTFCPPKVCAVAAILWRGFAKQNCFYAASAALEQGQSNILIGNVSCFKFLRQWNCFVNRVWDCNMAGTLHPDREVL